MDNKTSAILNIDQKTGVRPQKASIPFSVLADHKRFIRHFHIVLGPVSLMGTLIKNDFVLA